MKNKLFLLVALLFSFVNSIWANDDIVFVTKVENKQKVIVPMRLEIDGHLKLFSVTVDQTSLVKVSATQFRTLVMSSNKEYYLGNGYEVELVTSSNLKNLAKKYFSDTPELLKRIGKRGFKYENLPSMILYHNKFISKGKPLTRADLKHWSVIN